MNAKCEISCSIPSYLRQVWTAKKETVYRGRISLSMTLPLLKLSTTSENFGSCSLFFFFFFFSSFFLPPFLPLPPFHRQTVRSLVFSPTTTPVCPFAIPWINNWTNMRVRKHDENFNRWLSVRSLVQNYLLISLFHRLFHTLYFTLPSLFLTVSISIFLYGSGRESCDKEFFAQLPY